jgi:hypothetical protein
VVHLALSLTLPFQYNEGSTGCTWAGLNHTIPKRFMWDMFPTFSKLPQAYKAIN